VVRPLVGGRLGHGLALDLHSFGRLHGNLKQVGMDHRGLLRLGFGHGCLQLALMIFVGFQACPHAAFVIAIR
jgi:hypothetical protein